MEKMIVTNDVEFYGFLNGMDIVDAGKIAETLRSKAVCAVVYEDETEQDVIDAIIRRNGVFYTGIEAKKLAPWNIMNTCIFAARFEYLEDDIRSANPAYAEYDWCVLDGIQYIYGKYLQKQIAEGKLIK